MCQEKVENKIKFSGSCMDVNTGAEVIFEGYREGGNLLLEAKCISDILKKQAAQGQKAQQFLVQSGLHSKNVNIYLCFQALNRM